MGDISNDTRMKKENSVKILFYEKIPIDYLCELYISDCGLIRDFEKNIDYKHFESNYDRIVLPLKNGKRKFFSIHRLIALTFIENNDPTKSQVNHKDENKLNNHVSNLEWVSPKDNVKHSLDNNLSKGRSVKVRCIDKKTKNIVGVFENILLASKATGANDRHISDVCRGTRKTCGGYIWEYVNDEYFQRSSNSIEPDGIVYKHYDNYIFSDTGNCYSFKSRKYLNPKITPSGNIISLCFYGEKKDFLLHRIIAELYLENSHNKKRVKHIDKNKSNNRVSNLLWY